MSNQTQMSPAVRVFGGATSTTFTLFLTGSATFLLFHRLPDTWPGLALVVLLYVKGLFMAFVARRCLVGAAVPRTFLSPLEWRALGAGFALVALLFAISAGAMRLWWLLGTLIYAPLAATFWLLARGPEALLPPRRRFTAS